MQKHSKEPTTGMPELDHLLGGIIRGDNIVWEVDSGAPVDSFISSFIRSSEQAGLPLVYISFNRSPQTITGKYRAMMSTGKFTLIDCFSSGKGDNDEVFLSFFKTDDGDKHSTIHIEYPADPANLQNALLQARTRSKGKSNYIFDSLTGMLDLWGDEDKVVRFFGHLCPQLYDLETIACWYLETGAHTEAFLAKIRHVTQIVLDVQVQRGIQTLTIKKAANRSCAEIGSSQCFRVSKDHIEIETESRSDRELKLLTSIGHALGQALDPESFFDSAMQALAKEFGMIRGTLVLLDRASDALKIAAAHGLSAGEKARGVYNLGEGVVGHVVETGVSEVVPDISRDPRFLNRAVDRRAVDGAPVAFICVPLKIDEEVVGALSVDRPFAVETTLERDLRLLSIVGSIVAQVIKMNRLVRVEKEEILTQRKDHIGELRSRYRLDNVIGESEAIRGVLSTAATAARSRASILITGETGTGKELVANVVHYNSDRSSGPLVKVNCGALPENLLESELFGHMKGAFTGALRDRKGRFEVANTGTLFLDEISEMSTRLQVKLLRVLQEREFEPVGSSRTVSVDVRVVAATSRDLKDEIRHGRFREDLFYRLNVIPIHLPPLRERREDIPVLVDHFLEKYNSENHKKVTKLSREVLDLLVEYPWVGNVRELENCIERAVVMSPGEVLIAELLPSEILEHRKASVSKRAIALPGDTGGVRTAAEQFCRGQNDFGEARQNLIKTVEEAVIRAALRQKLSQRDLAARLNISRMTLRKRMREYGISG